MRRGHEVTVPSRLDSLILPMVRASETDDAKSRGELDGVAEEWGRQFLFGVWLTATAVVTVGFLLLVLAIDSPSLGALAALVTAVPGSMALLRGVVDAVSLSGALPKYTTSTAIWLVCYVTAAVGFLFAFVD